MVDRDDADDLSIDARREIVGQDLFDPAGDKSGGDVKGRSPATSSSCSYCLSFISTLSLLRIGIELGSLEVTSVAVCPSLIHTPLCDRIEPDWKVKTRLSLSGVREWSDPRPSPGVTREAGGNKS